jgi:hypothetical protein
MLSMKTKALVTQEQHCIWRKRPTIEHQLDNSAGSLHSFVDYCTISINSSVTRHAGLNFDEKSRLSRKNFQKDEMVLQVKKAYVYYIMYYIIEEFLYK